MPNYTNVGQYIYLHFFNIHDLTDKYKKLGEPCSINGKNCVGELVCKKMEDGCDNGVGMCQPNGRKRFSLSISLRIWIKLINIWIYYIDIN